MKVIAESQICTTIKHAIRRRSISTWRACDHCLHCRLALSHRRRLVPKDGQGRFHYTQEVLWPMSRPVVDGGKALSETDITTRGRGLLGCCSGFTHNYAERYLERFTVTQCSENLVTTHNVPLRIREDLGPSTGTTGVAERLDS